MVKRVAHKKSTSGRGEKAVRKRAGKKKVAGAKVKKIKKPIERKSPLNKKKVKRPGKNKRKFPSRVTPKNTGAISNEGYQEDIMDVDDMPLHNWALIRAGVKRVTASIFPGGNLDQGTEFDDRLFQQIDQVAPIDLAPAQLQAGQRFSMRAYRVNTRAKRCIELMKDFSIGTGVKFEAEDPKVQELLDEHWWINRWEKNLVPRFRAWSIFGEQLWPAFVRPEDGIVTISSISPFRILQVLRNRENAEELVGVKTAKRGGVHGPSIGSHIGTDEKQDFRFWEIIRLGRDGKYTGNAFYFPLNMVSGATRGLPDLLASLDWLEGLDSFAFSFLERVNMAYNVVFDLEVKGGRGKEITKQVNRLVKDLKSGTVYGHNENINLSVKTPNVASMDANAAVSILLKQIQSGTGFAGMFYGDSEDLTRASAAELSLPVSKMIEGRQKETEMMLSEIFDFQIQKTLEIKNGRLAGVTNFKYRFTFPKVLLRDTKTQASALNTAADALQKAMESGWITKDQASQVFVSILEGITPFPETKQELGAVGDHDDLTDDEMTVAQAMERSGQNVGSQSGHDNGNGSKMNLGPSMNRTVAG